MVSYGLHHLKRSINHGLSTASGGRRSARNPIVLKLLVNSLMGLISSHPPQSCGPLAIALSGEARSGGGDEVQYEPAAATDACPDQSMGGLSSKEAATTFPASSATSPHLPDNEDRVLCPPDLNRTCSIQRLKIEPGVDVI